MKFNYCRMITYDQWLEKCESTKQMAITELQDTLRLRESLFVAAGRARNALRAQTDVTNYMLRRRIYDTQRARNELDWQKMKVSIWKLIERKKEKIVDVYLFRPLWSIVLIFLQFVIFKFLLIGIVSMNCCCSFLLYINFVPCLE